MLHGYLSNKESFNYVTNFFKNYFRVIAVDLLGFGESGELLYPYSLDDYVKSVIDFLDTLKIESYDLIAHSFGGRIAIKLACVDKRLKKLVLTGSAGLKPRRKLGYYVKVYTYKILKKFVNKDRLKNFGSKEYKTLSPIMKQSYVLIVNEYLEKYLSKINNKVLLIFGKYDKETPKYFYKRFLKNIKNAKGVILENSGHFCFVDEPTKFNYLVKEFLMEDI